MTMRWKTKAVSAENIQLLCDLMFLSEVCESRQKLPEAAVLSTVQLPFRRDHLDFDPGPCLVRTKNPSSFFTDCLWPFPNITSCTVNGIAIRCFKGKLNLRYVRDYFTVQYVLLPFGSNLIFWHILQSSLRNLADLFGKSFWLVLLNHLNSQIILSL